MLNEKALEAKVAAAVRSAIAATGKDIWKLSWLYHNVPKGSVANESEKKAA